MPDIDTLIAAAIADTQHRYSDTETQLSYGVTIEWAHIAEAVRRMRYDDRVADGAAWLDGVDPGWRNRIDPVSLNLGSCFDCTLGQLAGRFSTRENRLAFDSVVGTGIIGDYLDSHPDEDLALAAIVEMFNVDTDVAGELLAMQLDEDGAIDYGFVAGDFGAWGPAELANGGVGVPGLDVAYLVLTRLWRAEVERAVV